MSLDKSRYWRLHRLVLVLVDPRLQMTKPSMLLSMQRLSSRNRTIQRTMAVAGYHHPIHNQI
jgi:hypothetical protein